MAFWFVPFWIYIAMQEMFHDPSYTKSVVSKRNVQSITSEQYEPSEYNYNTKIVGRAKIVFFFMFRLGIGLYIIYIGNVMLRAEFPKSFHRRTLIIFSPPRFFLMWVLMSKLRKKYIDRDVYVLILYDQGLTSSVISSKFIVRFHRLFRHPNCNSVIYIIYMFHFLITVNMYRYLFVTKK